jgi:hypothetical protein
MKFSIRDLFLVTVIVAMALGWGLDHWRQANQNRHEREVNKKMVDWVESRQWVELGGDGLPMPERLPSTSGFPARFNGFSPPNSSAPAPNPSKP